MPAESNRAGEQRATPAAKSKGKPLIEALFRIQRRNGGQRVTPAAERGGKVPIRAQQRIGRQLGVWDPETWAERGLVRAGLMHRTWNDWGFRNGVDDTRARLLLKALQAQAAGKALDELEWEGCGRATVALLSARIDRLVARTRLNKARLADELAHDIKLWKRHWDTMPDLSQGMAGGGPADKTARFRSLSGSGPVRGRYAANRHVGNTIATIQDAREDAKSPGDFGDSNGERVASASPCRSAASAAAGSGALGPPSQTADVMAPSRPAHANKLKWTPEMGPGA